MRWVVKVLAKVHAKVLAKVHAKVLAKVHAKVLAKVGFLQGENNKGKGSRCKQRARSAYPSHDEAGLVKREVVWVGVNMVDAI